MKTIAKYQSRAEAQIAQSYLLSHGIIALLPGSETLSMMPNLPFGLTGYHLLVQDAEADQARTLLEELPAPLEETMDLQDADLQDEEETQS